jgi:DNA-directed RNA polymerase subunit RPC12/RpoP
MGKDYEILKGEGEGPCVAYRCPECGHQIESLLSDAGSRDNCPSCGKAVIVPGEAELRPPKEAEASQQEPNDRFAVGRTFYAAVDAAVAKAALDEAGIPCLAEYFPRNPQYPTVTRYGEGRILVREQDAERANEIINEALKIQPADATDFSPESEDEMEPEEE